MPPITDALTALRAEERQLDAQLTKVRQAIAVLGGSDTAPTRKKAAKKKAKRTRKPMSAAMKKAVSARMKKYWAKRKKAAKKSAKS